ncbi:lysine--tRNA ligase [Candidatus Gottesmanbacteria bacterium]|nr:lysine--tRNA ligase [Candidatus Gottesmanbacteria bacterium]
MFWADKIAKEIIDSGGFVPYWVDDMFTPSGYAHIGSLRGPLVHDIVYRALRDAEKDTAFTYVFNDFDPVDGLPPELSHMSSELGKPLRIARSPESGHSSFAEYFASDFKKVLITLGVRADFRSSWDMYHDGKFNEVIRIALDHAEVIQDIYQRVSGSKKREKGWLPIQVICEKCGKLGTTRVHHWDGKMVAYTCEPDMVAWARGCGYTGRISPFDGNGKLPWKVDWPAHWSVMGVTIEGAGKDHSSAGGSRDIAKELCKEVFGISDPYNLPYEFFLIGGKKMSSSKGLGLKARDLTGVLPPSVGRFLFTRTDYRQAIEFDPVDSMAIPDLFDEFDRCWQAYNTGLDEDFSRAFVLSQVGEIPPKQQLFLPRFRDVANYMQLANIHVEKKFEEMKGSSLNVQETEILKEREKYARVWIERYAPQAYRMQMSPSVPDTAKLLTEKQKEYLYEVVKLLHQAHDADALQIALYAAAKKLSLDSKEAFAGVYLALTGKTHGPKAAWFLLQYAKDDVTKRLEEVASGVIDQLSISKVQVIQKSELFSIDEAVKKAFPEVSIGIALIRGAHITKTHPDLEKEKHEFLSSLQGVTTEILGTYSELISYRKLYRVMGIDWHSRRPSPEALLRRIALGKGLYTVNTCVDAYNLVVMKYRVSVGAFDYDNVKFPTVLRYAGEGDEILLLGDKEPTKYTAKELAYYDQNGGYNIDFNYRDAQRTMVTENTKNIWINVDGVYGITPTQVERSLQESIAMITKYCGGTVEFQGVVA